MEIIKAFQKNELGININIKGTHESPLFRASDIGEVLDIYNIRQNIQEFDNTEKDAVCLTDSMGRKQEVTFLTEKGLYKVLFRSRKPIAEQFQDWVCEVIKEIRLNGIYDLQKQLDAEKKKNENLTKKKYGEKQKGEYVYIYKSSSDPNDINFKVGKTDNLKTRESDYLCGNPHGKIVYHRECVDSLLVEKTVHLMLDKYRVINNREWFEVSLETIKEYIDKSVELQYLGREKSTEIPTEKIIETKKDISIQISNPSDYDKFIKDMCDLDESYFCIKNELYGAYRLWSRAMNAKTTEDARLYFESFFKKGTKFFENYDKSTLAIYKGVKLKEIKHIPSNPPNNFDNFVTECCDVGPIYRLSAKDLVIAYKRFKNDSDSLEILNLKDYIGKKYVMLHVCIKNGNVQKIGYWGLKLKTNNEILGLKVANSLRKKVTCTNLDTKETITFGSVTEAGRHFGICASGISCDIRTCRIRNGYSITCEGAENKQIKEKYERGKHKKVYKYKDEKLIEEFKSTLKASEDAGINPTTFNEKCLLGKNIGDFLYTYAKMT